MSLILPYSTRVGFSGPGIRIAKSEVRISAVRRKPACNSLCFYRSLPDILRRAAPKLSGMRRTPPGDLLHFCERSTSAEIVGVVRFPMRETVDAPTTHAAILVALARENAKDFPPLRIRLLQWRKFKTRYNHVQDGAVQRGKVKIIGNTAVEVSGRKLRSNQSRALRSCGTPVGSDGTA